MSADVQHPLLIDIKDILKQRVDFSSPSKSEFKDVIPDNYNVLIPDRYRRGGSSSYGSPSTSNGDQLNSRRNSVSESECSTASSSPLSITKELTSVSSPLTPRSDVSRSKSKSQSPSRSGLTCSFLSEKSKSPTPIPGLGLMELDQIPLPSDEPELNAPPACESKTKSEREKEAPIENGTGEVPTRREKKKKKKKSKKRKRSRSPVSLVSTTETQHHNSPERESSPSLCSSNSTSTEATQSSRDNDTNGTVKRAAESSISCLVNGEGSRVPPIRLKLSSKEEKKPLATATNLSAIFQQTPMQPKKLTIKVGATVMSRPLVAYSGSDEESESEEEGDTPDTSETTVKAEPSTIVNGISSTKKEEKEKKRIVPIPVSPRTIIGPLKPSRETDKNVETMKAPIGPVKPSSSTNGEVAAPTREKRKNGSLQDPTSSKRKRLLSERGETEAAYPVMDRTTISSWNWKECAAVRSRARGVGLHNSSNDCFLNAILQLITHTAPLARYIYESHQKERCSRPPGQCLCCAMCNSHLKRVFSGQGGAFMASWIRPYLRRIFPSHMHGMQEDAHELLSLMLDAFDPPPGHNKTHPNALVNAKPSTPIEQIFGGTLRNQVTCTGCDTPYTNYERIRELNLAIRKRADGDSIRISNLMDNYFRDENLTSFDCKKCGRKTTATRRTRVLRPPAVLLVQLKRFNAFGGKIRLPVSADMEVDLLRFLYDGSSPVSSSQYVLTSVVEHLGAGVDHGHYVAYSRGFQGSQWYLFDDEQVQAVPAAKVVGSNPYLLVYSRRCDMGISSKSSSEVVQKPMGIGFNSTKQQNGFGPNQKKNHLHSNGGGSDMNRSFNNGRFNNNGNSKWNNGKPRHSFPQSSQKKWMPNLI